MCTHTYTHCYLTARRTRIIPVACLCPNEAEALRRLETVFSRLRVHGLKLPSKKCHLLRRSVKFLGHIVDKNGVSTDPDKVRALSYLSSKMAKGTTIH